MSQGVENHQQGNDNNYTYLIGFRISYQNFLIQIVTTNGILQTNPMVQATLGSWNNVNMLANNTKTPTIKRLRQKQ